MGNIYLNDYMSELTFFVFQRFHQRQLLEETRGGCPSPPRPTQLDVKSQSPSHAGPQGGARDLKTINAPTAATFLAVQETGMIDALSLHGTVPVDIMHSFLIVSLYKQLCSSAVFFTIFLFIMSTFI